MSAQEKGPAVSEQGRTRIPPSHLQAGGVELAREILALPRYPVSLSAADRLELATEEGILRDLVVEWTFALDARDLDAMVSLFAENGVLVNGRGRYVGRDAIRENYKLVLSRWESLRHFWANVVIRYPDRIDEAYLTAYHYGLVASPDRERTVGHIGTDVWHLSKLDDGRWKIVERWLTFDADHELAGWTDRSVAVSEYYQQN